MESRKSVKVEDVFRWYEEGGIKLLKEKFSDPSIYVDEFSWVNHIKKSIEKKLHISVELEINTLLEKYKSL